MSNCNKCRPKSCGCEEASVCGCDIKLDLLCAFYSGENLQPLGIEAGMDGNTVIKIINDYIKNFLEELDLDPTVIQSVGNGAKVYKGLSSEFRHEIKSLLAGEGVVITEQDNTVTISFDSSIIPASTTVENLGTGAVLSTEIEAGKEYGVKSLTSLDSTIGITDNGTSIDLKSNVNIPLTQLQGIGEGVDIYAGMSGTSANIRRIKDSDTIVATLDSDGSILLEAPQSPDDSIKQYYVNENYTGGGSSFQGNGSILKPYKKYTYALRDIIGTGKASAPQFPNSTITLLSNVTITQADLDLVPKLNNRLSVNSTTTISNGDSKFFILYTGSSSFNFPFDTTSLIEEDLQGGTVLSRDISLIYRNVALSSSNTVGVIRGWAYDGDLSSSSNKKIASLTLDRVSYFSSYRTEDPDVYKIITDKNGNNIQLFGSNVLAEVSQPNSPHMLLYGSGNNGNGEFYINDLDMGALCGSAVRLEKTACNFTGITTVAINNYRIPVQSLTPINPGEYLPKNTISLIDLDTSFFTIEELNMNYAHPNAIVTKDGVDVAKLIGGYNSIFSLKKNISSSSQYTIGVTKGYVTAGLVNRILEVDTTNGTPRISLNNMDYSRLDVEIGSFIRIAGTIKPTIDITGSNFKKVMSDTVSNVFLNASDAIVNGYQFRNPTSFSNDNDAKTLGGLIIGNIYYNSTVGAMKQIQS